MWQVLLPLLAAAAEASLRPVAAVAAAAGVQLCQQSCRQVGWVAPRSLPAAAAAGGHIPLLLVPAQLLVQLQELQQQEQKQQAGHMANLVVPLGRRAGMPLLPGEAVRHTQVAPPALLLVLLLAALHRTSPGAVLHPRALQPQGRVAALEPPGKVQARQLQGLQPQGKAQARLAVFHRVAVRLARLGAAPVGAACQGMPLLAGARPGRQAVLHKAAVRLARPGAERHKHQPGARHMGLAQRLGRAPLLPPVLLLAQAAPGALAALGSGPGRCCPAHSCYVCQDVRSRKCTS